MKNVITMFDNLKSPSVWRELLDMFRVRKLGCLQVEISSYCRGKCVYCPHTVYAGNWKSRHMESDTFGNLWSLMCKVSRVHLQGWGEPFLHPYFMDFAKLALRAGCQVSTTTCGLYMDEKIAQQLVDSGIDVIAFSLAGASASSNNKYREGIPFDQLEHAVHLLQSTRKARQAVHMEIHLAYLLLASNLDELWKLPELMDDWGVHETIISTLDYIPSPRLSSEAFLPHERDKIKAAQAVIDEVTLKIRAAGKEIYACLPDHKPAPQCREQAQKSLYVDADGIVSPCVFLNVPTRDGNSNKKTFGSVNEEEPLSIWAKDEYRAFRNALNTLSPDRVCENCIKRFEKSFF